MELKKEWYDEAACRYIDGDIDEVVRRVKEKRGISEHNVLALCDQCGLSTAIGIFMGTQPGENIMIIHGPTGCSQLMGTAVGARYVTTTSRDSLSSKDYYIPFVVSSGIEEKEVVFGGTKKLREAVLYVHKRFKPKLITILTTCSTQIIGDDVAGLIKQLEKEVDTKIIYVPTSGLVRSYNGYDQAYQVLIDALVDPNRPKIKGSINIVGDKRRTGGEINFTDINRVFKKLGIKVNCRFVRNTTIEQIKGLAQAELNIMMCHHAGIMSAKYLKEKFGMPYYEFDYPMGIGECVVWYRDILAMLGMEDKEGVLEKEYEQAYPRFEAARQILKGKTVACMGSPGRMVRWIDLIHELGMIPVYMGIYMHLRDLSFKLLEVKMKKYGFNPHIVVQPGLFDDEELLAKYKPDFMFGEPSYSHFAFRNDIPFCHLELAPQLGFSGSVNIAERWADAVRQPVYDFWHKYTDITGHTPRIFKKCVRVND